MTDTIAILDDEPERVAEMTGHLQRLHPRFRIVTFDNAPDCIEWLRNRLATCVLICLDHDLGPNRDRDGNLFDPGTGRDVVDYLATLPPACPVIVHTTNTLACPGMLLTLQDANWAVTHVAPYEHLLWIREAWINAIGEALSRARAGD